MIVWFPSIVFISAVMAYCVVRHLGHRWTLKDTLFFMLVPLVCFLTWVLLWWFKVLPAERLPTTWLDEVPTLGERAFFCLPPLLVSCLLFPLWRRVSHRSRAA